MRKNYNVPGTDWVYFDSLDLWPGDTVLFDITGNVYVVGLDGELQDRHQLAY
jgi:hypothetical protein